MATTRETPQAAIGKPLSDACSRLGAQFLAARLQAYWSSAPGVEVWVWKAAHNTARAYNEPRELWCVRSNLVNGLPP